MMESGVRAEEVSYQLKYSKQELRKCIKEYTGKEVKKGLESLYHKITKHTSENEYRLLRVTSGSHIFYIAANPWHSTFSLFRSFGNSCRMNSCDSTSIFKI